MDYLTCLEGDYRRLAQVTAGIPGATVPSCPEWTVDDLVHHVARVYLHKVECMRRNALPEPWPPPELATEPAHDLLARAYAALVAEFAAREPSAPAYTWFPHDQTVGFWMRRMAHETVIHRIDGELAMASAHAAGSPEGGVHAGGDSLTVPDELALDGIDEVLRVFLVWASREWPEDFAEAMSAGPGSIALTVIPGTVTVPSPIGRWLVTWDASSGVRAEAGGTGDADADADAEIKGTADAILRWLWRRAETEVIVEGGKAQVAQMRQLLHAATQ